MGLFQMPITFLLTRYELLLLLSLELMLNNSLEYTMIRIVF